MKKLLSTCLAALLLLSMAGCGKTDTAVVDAAKTDTTEPKTEGIGTHRAEIEIQDYGTVTVELDGDAAPITVQNFMDLANAGFYNGLTFQQVPDLRQQLFLVRGLRRHGLLGGRFLLGLLQLIVETVDGLKHQKHREGDNQEI